MLKLQVPNVTLGKVEAQVKTTFVPGSFLVRVSYRDFGVLLSDVAALGLALGGTEVRTDWMDPAGGSYIARTTFSEEGAYGICVVPNAGLNPGEMHIDRALGGLV